MLHFRKKLLVSTVFGMSVLFNTLQAAPIISDLKLSVVSDFELSVAPPR